MKRICRLAAMAALLLAAPAAANDSVAVMGAGGLILQRTDGIEMRSEDLYVSAREIRVRYRFFNRTGEPITTLVAFPLPDITGGGEGDRALTDPLAMPFSTTVDGRRMATNVEQKAVFEGVDHTGLLRGLEVPLSPVALEASAAIDALPLPQREMLREMGLVREESDRGWVPLWTLKTTRYWAQVFPAGREVGIDHRYVPAIGGSAGSVMGDTALAGSEIAADYAARYCTDRDFVAAARRMRTRGRPMTETWIDYVLVTGANWAEPIGDFRLTVDKGAWGNLVSFCGEGVRRTGLTTFEMRKRDFTPTRDLSVLILSSDRPQD